MEWVASTLTSPPNVVYRALLKLMRTPRLPAIDWPDAPTDLNGFVRFGERRNLVSARVPSRSARAIPYSFVLKSAKMVFITKTCWKLQACIWLLILVEFVAVCEWLSLSSDCYLYCWIVLKRITLSQFRRRLHNVCRRYGVCKTCFVCFRCALYENWRKCKKKNFPSVRWHP